jgi:hypothetical protein
MDERIPGASAPNPLIEIPLGKSRTDPPATPFTRAEVDAALVNPLRAIDVVLASPRRLAQNVETASELVPLVLLLLFSSALFALPFGFVLGLDAWWRIGVLYLGSTLICLPSLYVFSAYLGFGTSFPRVAVPALTIPAVAAIFTAGFAPILGFLRVTFDNSSTQIRWQQVGFALLWIALAAGIAQLWRCLRRPTMDTNVALFVLLWIAWHAVFLYVLVRMAHVLELAR